LQDKFGTTVGYYLFWGLREAVDDAVATTACPAYCCRNHRKSLQPHGSTATGRQVCARSTATPIL